MLIPALLLVAVLALLGWFVRNDRAEYEAFKAFTRTEDRQRAFRRWAAKSFLLFWGASLVVLVLIGRAGTVRRLPPEFAPLLPHLPGGFDAGTMPFVIGGVIGGGIIGAVAGTLLKRNRTAKPKVLGDIEPLLPRNADERRWTALLGVNAAIGEELFFRLMLPLLIALVTGSAIVAFLTAGLIFGAVHFYQGLGRHPRDDVRRLLLRGPVPGKRDAVGRDAAARRHEPQQPVAAAFAGGAHHTEALTNAASPGRGAR